ncbi:MAG: hypothetical protein AAB925_02940 [Patescibacteria group bacterium]
MALSNFLAELWGISIVAVSLTLLVKEKYIKRLFAKIEAEESLFCWGFATFIIGLAMVLAHNIWVKNWQVVITIFGWLFLIKGLSMLFFPEFLKKWAKKIKDEQWLPIALVATLFVGLALTYLGFTA